MEIPFEVVFRHMEPAAMVDERIRREIDRIQRYSDQLVAGRVVVEGPNAAHRHGGLYKVNVHLRYRGAPGVDIARSGPRDHAHESALVAIRDAFAAARRRLQDRSRRLHGKVKQHEVPLHGRVTQLFPEQGYGYLTASDGREVFFHRNAVLDDAFDRLAAGSEVRLSLAEGEGEKGPQASSVSLVGKHHLVP